ncbi:MAG: ABC transporter substrate-binding protein [Candidatus Wallbacteria bacterium]|nr:ABC transporter substrate-binding protein [Candidatus Wallbacteria bacterium]
MAADPIKVSFQPQWYHQAQFAGYYVAKDTGIYEKYGLDVDILEGSPISNVSKSLQSGEVVFATQTLTTGIREKASGRDIVCLSQILQKSSLLILSKKSNGIGKVSDLNGRSLGVWNCDFEILINEFIRKNNLSMKIIPILSTINVFLYAGIDSVNALSYNEYHQIINSGFEPAALTVFDFNEFGLDFPEDGIYCLKKTFDQSSEVCTGFAKASIEGWLYAFEHPKQAVDICLKYIENMKGPRQPSSQAQQAWMLQKLKDLILVKDRSMGNLSAEKYHQLGLIMLEQKAINAIPQFEDFYKGTIDAQK